MRAVKNKQTKKNTLHLGEGKSTLWFEYSIEVCYETIVCLPSFTVNYFVSSPWRQFPFVIMYDISACSATRVYDGNLMEDLFSWETLFVKRNKHRSCLSVCYCEFLNLHFGLKRVCFIEIWKVSVTFSALESSSKCQKKKKNLKNSQPSKYPPLHHAPHNPSSNDTSVCPMLCFFWESSIYSSTAILI